MKKNVRALLIGVMFFAGLASAAWSQETDGLFLAQGYEAYRSGDWKTALFIFRRAVASKEGATEENYFMLIMTEIFAEDYRASISDADTFITLFPTSKYLSYVYYQRARDYFLLGQPKVALPEFTAFCSTWPDHELYPSALFWIAECFYGDFNFEAAKALYERIVKDFPTDPKAVDARYRIETIDQRGREEKILYLLKVTGEEYLAAKEEYEKQLSLNRVEGVVDLQNQMKSLSGEMLGLKAELDEERQKANAQEALINQLRTENAEARQVIQNTEPPPQPQAQAQAQAQTPPRKNAEVNMLLEKARLLQTILDSEKQGGGPK
ncbi:MAG: tetratricopeptide repeat protein [Spirochaetaceae bacterium]|jgi:TolA-binding protein|nr:tetratricopeptide repeat protein [Spirochaetaceae bacterium]